MLVLEKPEEYAKSNQQTDYDGLWKKIISELFEEFVLLIDPDFYKVIDFNKGHSFLEQELHQQAMDTKKGKKYVDKIVKVFLQDGTEKYILIHVEVQDNHDSNFSLRMFQYFYKIYDNHQKEIYAIALLTNPFNTVNAYPFHYSFFGTEITYRYHFYQFSEEKISKLETSSNPFATAIIAGIQLHLTKDDPQKRMEIKRKLLKTVLDFERYPQELTITALFYFIDYLLHLPDELTKQLREDIIPIIEKEADHMIYSEKVETSPTLAEILEKYKREERAEGRVEGALLERKNLAKELILENFTDEKIAKMTRLTIDEVREIRKNL